MLSTTLWVMALVLEIVTLTRALQGNFLKHYRFFYGYLGRVLVSDLSLIPFYYVLPKIYPYAYWSNQFFSVVVGCCVVWEVYKVALGPYPGAARMARNVLALMFILAITRIFVKVWSSPNWIPGKTTLETERDLRIVQLALLIGLVALFTSYAIPLGRNLKGIVYGYGLFTATSVAHLTLRGYLGDSFQRAWQYIQPICYLVVLLVWCLLCGPMRQSHNPQPSRDSKPIMNLWLPQPGGKFVQREVMPSGPCDREGVRVFPTGHGDSFERLPFPFKAWPASRS